MVVYGLIEKVSHDRLEPTATYIKKGSIVPIDMELSAIHGKFKLVRFTDTKDPEKAKLSIEI